MAAKVLTIPNLVSFARLLGIPLILYFGLVTENDVAAFAVFVIASVTDWLDGWLARKLNQYSDLGAQLDPIADRLYIFTALVVMVMRDLLPLWMVGLVVLRELVLGLHLIDAKRNGYGPAEVHYVGKAGTLLLLYALPFIFLGQMDNMFGDLAHWFGRAFFIWGIGTYWYAAWLYRHQYQAARHG